MPGLALAPVPANKRQIRIVFPQFPHLMNPCCVTRTPTNVCRQWGQVSVGIDGIAAPVLCQTRFVGAPGWLDRNSTVNYTSWYECIKSDTFVPMTVHYAQPQLGSLSSLIGEGIRSLDITAAERRAAVERYEGLGAAFDDHWKTSTRTDNLIIPQGSFALGTVVRNIHRNDEIDLDAVSIRGIDKTSITQQALKEDAGEAVTRYALNDKNDDRPRVTECERCWTLHWSDMHLDLLPAIPNREPGEDGILITDRDVHDWLQSNPAGYADWFRNQMTDALTAAFEAKRLQVDDVPEWQIKTTLQQTVQALKRHRDVFFSKHLEDRPASIILTTLAARSYPTGGGDLYDVLRDVTARMQDFVERRHAAWWVTNPVQSKENFADGWAEHTERAAWFFRWLEAAVDDFNNFGVKSGLEHSMPLVASAFGERVAAAAAFGYGQSISSVSAGGRLRLANGGVLASVAPDSGVVRPKVRSHHFAGGQLS